MGRASIAPPGPADIVDLPRRQPEGQKRGQRAENDFIAVTAGTFHATALREDGSLVSWGKNAFEVVTRTPTESDFVAVAAGPAHGHGTALRENGTLVSWGNDEFGQVRRTPPGSDFVAVAAGSLYGIALREDGSLVSWGDDSRAVTETPEGNDFVAVAGGQSTSFAIRVAAADELAPVIQITSPADSATYVIGREVVADYACTDEDGGSGLASCTGSVANDAPLNTAEVGTKTFVVDAADEAGNTATLTHTYTVVYGFRGFFPPLKNDGEFNKAKAGRTIPLKWRLVDADGQPVTNLSSVNVAVEDMACELGGTADQLKESAPGSSGLQNLGDGNYQLNWKTPSAYARSCKTLHLDLGDGMTHTALFYFSR